MKKILDRTKLLIDHLDILESVLRTNTEYQAAVRDLDDSITDPILDSIYPKVNEEKNGRQMCLADIIEYIVFGRTYWEIVNRRTDNTRLSSFKDYYKILLKIINVLYLQDSILSQSSNFNLRQDLINQLKQKISDETDSYQSLNEFEKFLYAPWGDSRSETQVEKEQRESIYKKLDQLLPKVRGLPNELIAYIHLLRKNCGLVLPLFLNQRFISFNLSSDEGKVDSVAPPDLFILGENKNILGIEVGRGSDRQINKFSKRTGIPVVCADTENISNHRCPYCMKWTLFCDFIIEHGMDPSYRDIDVMECKNCNIAERDNGRNCPNSLVKTNIPDYYLKNAHYHYKCIENYYQDQSLTPQQIIDKIPEQNIFTYFPHVDGLDELTNLYFRLP